MTAGAREGRKVFISNGLISESENVSPFRPATRADINRHTRKATARSKGRTAQPIPLDSIRRVIGWQSRSVTSDSHAGIVAAKGHLELARQRLSDDSRRRRESQASTEQKHFNYEQSPQPAIDSVNCCHTVLDSCMHRILQYFLKQTVPSKSSTHLTNIMGFTPTGKDQETSHWRLTIALQADQDMHLYALLAATAGRMRSISHLQIEPHYAPASYALNAIQSLKNTVRHSLPVSQLVALDITYLCIWEFHSNDSHIHGLWSLLRDIMIACGGFVQCQPFISYFSMGIDVVHSTRTLLPVTHDFDKYPGLLGADYRPNDPTDIERNRDAFNVYLTRLDPRVAVVCRGTRHYHALMAEIHRLPGPALVQARTYMSTQSRKVSRYFSAALQPIEGGLLESSDHDVPLEADCLYREARFHGVLLWLWHMRQYFYRQHMRSLAVSLPCAPTTNPTSDDFRVNSINMMTELLMRAEDKLSGTAWVIPSKIMLWSLAIKLLSQQDEDAGVMRRYKNIVRTVRADGMQDLKALLSDMPPLDIVREDALRQLALWARDAA